MKKLFFITTIFLFGFAVQSHAQDYDYDDDYDTEDPNTGFSFRLGIKGGLNFANLNSDTDTESKTGFHGGAFATFKFSRVAVQPEVIFSQQGGTFNFNGDNLESNFSYINIPILLKVYVVGGLNLQIGPQFGFLESAELDNEDIEDELEKSEVSLGLGVGWDLPFGFTVNGRYNIGLTEINDSAPTWNAKNQVFQFSIGYRLIQVPTDEKDSF